MRPVSSCPDCGEVVVPGPPRSWRLDGDDRVLVPHDQAACIRFLRSILRTQAAEIAGIREQIWRRERVGV